VEEMSVNQISKLTTYLDDTIRNCERMVKEISFKILEQAGIKNAETLSGKYASVYTYFVVNQTLNSVIGNHFHFGPYEGDRINDLAKYGKLKFADRNENKNVFKIYAPIKFNPGVYLNKADIQRETGLSLSVIKKALDFLEQNDLVVRYQNFYKVDCSVLHYRYVNYGI
jgi:hypothetical protein